MAKPKPQPAGSPGDARILAADRSLESVSVDKNARIYVAGHRGLVGSAIVRRLEEAGYTDLVTRTSAELDLTRQADTEAFFADVRPEYVFLSAARAGGIKANATKPAEFFYVNAMIACNVIQASYRSDVTKLLYLGSSCVYPRLARQPIVEDELLSGKLEPTNEAYALAKIGGLKLCDYYRQQFGCNFISAMPTSLYGIHDNFDLEEGHLVPSLMRKFHEAKLRDEPTVVLWGTGTVYRELMYADDLADALHFLMLNYDSPGHVNVGTGQDYTVLEYAGMVRRAVGYEGEIVHDLSKPDGIPRKQLDVSRMTALGWRPKYTLEEGLRHVYEWFSANYDQVVADAAKRRTAHALVKAEPSAVSV
jgi:GDP-L-fucose synthase